MYALCMSQNSLYIFHLPSAHREKASIMRKKLHFKMTSTFDTYNNSHKTLEPRI